MYSNTLRQCTLGLLTLRIICSLLVYILTGAHSGPTPSDTKDINPLDAIECGNRVCNGKEAFCMDQQVGVCQMCFDICSPGLDVAGLINCKTNCQRYLQIEEARRLADAAKSQFTETNSILYNQQQWLCGITVILIIIALLQFGSLVRRIYDRFFKKEYNKMICSSKDTVLTGTPPSGSPRDSLYKEELGSEVKPDKDKQADRLLDSPRSPRSLDEKLKQVQPREHQDEGFLSPTGGSP